MATNKIAIRQDTAANWTSSNPTLVLGEMGFESDTGAAKRGDGSTTWTSLAYLTNTGNGSIYLGGTAAANLLDDYEEGTWTPVYKGSTTDPTVDYGTTQSGRYTKIGNKVFIEGDIGGIFTASGLGVLSIGGLPFTANKNVPLSSLLIGLCADFVAVTAPSSAYISQNSTAISLNARETSDAQSDLVNVECNITGGSAFDNRVTVSGFYTTV